MNGGRQDAVLCGRVRSILLTDLAICVLGSVHDVGRPGLSRSSLGRRMMRPPARQLRLRFRPLPLSCSRPCRPPSPASLAVPASPFSVLWAAPTAFSSVSWAVPVAVSLLHVLSLFVAGSRLSALRPRTNSFARDRQCSVRSAVIPVMESPVLLRLGRDQEHNQYPHERRDEDS
jgi:hypothetical protein